MKDWIALNMTPGVGPRVTARLLEHFGSAEAIFDAPRRDDFFRTGSRDRCGGASWRTGSRRTNGGGDGHRAGSSLSARSQEISGRDPESRRSNGDSVSALHAAGL